MPTYAFECTSCGHTFDQILKIDDRKAPESNPCPECGETNKVESRIRSPRIVSDVGSLLSKTDNGWKETLSKIKETYTINNIKS
jgi:putative FmdB family regulatory protein